MTESVIQIDGMNISAGGRMILSVKHLAIAAGEVVTILGPNGAGKSTLLKCCLGFHRAATGELQILGQHIRRLGAGGLSRLRRRVGYVPQILASHGEMPLTLREVVAIGRCGLVGLLRPLGLKDWRIIDEWIERLGLANLSGAAYSDLSGGEQRKALIARAMVQQPELLVLDEPTANLDLFWREQIVAVMDELFRQTHMAIVMVCHELEVIAPCCRRVVLLEAGQITADGKPDEVLTNERIASLYGGGLAVMHDAGRHAVIPTGKAEG
ncbi:MAG: ABC transporter ATP-binding protein [Planctomycetota bacterium]|nr:ABC transporter ATP-binding protein [Planctomycetota bacterium]